MVHKEGREMNNYGRIIGVLTLAISVMLAASVIADDGKMPITTSSGKALEYYKQGRDLFEKLRFPDSRLYFEKAVAEDPDFAVGYLNLGFAMPSAKAFFENLEKAKIAMKNASEAERMWILGVEAGFTGNPAKQRDLYKMLVGQYPNDERARNLLGNYHFGQQEYELAIEQYDAAIEIAPEFTQPYNQLGYSYRFLQKFDQAEAAFRKYVELIPDDPNPYDSYAELLMKIGKFEESIEQYRKALSIDPTFAASYIGIATCYNFLGKHSAGRKVAQELYDNAVNDGQRRAAHFAKAVSYIDEGDLNKAIAEIEKQMEFAQKINDAASMAGDLFNIGNLLLEQNRPDEALEKYKQAVDVVQKSNLSEDLKKNNRLGFLFNEGRVALKKGDLSKAKSNQKEYAARAQANANRFQIWLSHEFAGLIAMEENDYETAISEFEQANLQNTYNLYRMAVAYEKIGDNVGAREMCDQTVDYNQLNSINYGLVRHQARRLMESM
jgi:tetratricopeptide (TPR) repeat protein